MASRGAGEEKVPVETPLPVEGVRSEEKGKSEEAGQRKVGDSRLHWAVANQASLGDVEVLLKECPALASEVNQEGETALHVAAANDVELVIVAALVRAHPEAVRAKNYFGQTPLATSCQTWQDVARTRTLTQRSSSSHVMPTKVCKTPSARY